MPTGYTCDVAEGKITTLNDFAMLCARAFGVCIDMRDASLDTPIPERFEPNTDHHDKRITELSERLSTLQNMTDDELEADCREAHEKSLTRRREYLEEKGRTRECYERMLDQVKSWKVPEELNELRGFMIEQLSESIRFDCGGDYVPDIVPMMSAALWREIQMASIGKDLSRWRENRIEEIQRVEKRNVYLKLLRASLQELENDA